ncbi:MULTISPECIES: CHASE domain-containing protein [Aerosakkonema]|uniref:CHASE domain-containing protein n=1 Tax=Aerosakkonema TaxID=1246629 RepID=UPI0035BABCEE
MKPDLPFKPTQGRRTWTPYFVLLLSLALTAIASYYVAVMARTKDELRFENAVQRTQNDIQQRLDTYITLLRTGSGLFAASEQVRRDEFRAYVDRLELRRTYPGIQGIGFSVRVSPSEKDGVIADMRKQGVKNFTIRPEYKRAEYHSIIYLEPLDRRNQAAIGFDMFSEPIRRAAMERARDTDSPAASGKVILVQEIDKNKQAGFLIYVPVYRNGTTPKTVAQRRAALQGFIYSPFRADDLMAGIFGNDKFPFLDFQIYDGTAPDAKNLLHSSDSKSNFQHRFYRPRFSTTRKINIAGRPWTIVFTSRPELDRLSETTLVPYIALVGVSIALILFGVTRSQVCARIAAECLAADLRDSEGALKESEERFRQLTEKVRIIPWEADAISGRFTYVGPQTVDILGYPLEDWYTDNFWAEHIYSEDREWAIEFCLNSTVSQENYEFEYRMLAADGEIVWLLDLVNVVRDENGPKLLRGILIDITDRKLVEAERSRLLEREQLARADAEAANRMKDEFLATLSHELRTPLNAMVGWTTLLRTRKFDEATTARALETIDRNTKALSQLIEDLLDVSRIMTGKFRFDLRPVNLAAAIEAAIDAVRSAAEAKNIIINSVFEDRHCLVSGDPTRLQQIVWNLLTNAIKFTPKGGLVEVHLDRHNSNAQITVIDTGQGISPEFLPHIFERFRQADASITRKHGGLGLGLAIVRHLVELHGGTIRAESPGEGQGAKFIVTLPFRAISDLSQVSEVSRSNEQELVSDRNEDVAIDKSLFLNNLSVLVVDDEPDARELVTAVLEKSGAKVTAVGSAKEAFAIITEAAAGRRPDIMISDIGMPEEDGYSLIRKIRALKPDRGGQIPAIALTAYARAEERARAIAAGFHIHIPKPVKPEELIAIVANLSNRFHS